MLGEQLLAVALVELSGGEGSLGAGEAGGSLIDGRAIGDVVELEEGLPRTDSLALADEDLGDEARDLGADLGVILPADDGRVAVVYGEVTAGEGADG